MHLIAYIFRLPNSDPNLNPNPQRTYTYENREQNTKKKITQDMLGEMQHDHNTQCFPSIFVVSSVLEVTQRAQPTCIIHASRTSASDPNGHA